MVVPTGPSRYSDKSVGDEELTYRESVKSIRATTQSIYDERLHALEQRGRDGIAFLSEQIAVARAEASTALVAMQRLLEASMSTNSMICETRFHGVREAHEKAEKATAIATGDVDQKSRMRHETATLLLSAVENKLTERLSSIHQLIDTKAHASEVAVEKAQVSTDRRFESVNEFRTTLSDQARDFVTIPVLAARVSQIDAQVDGLQKSITGVATRIDRREAAEIGRRELQSDGNATTTNVLGIIGGITGGLSLLVLVLVNILGHPTPPPQVAPLLPPLVNPTVGADTKRVDDLVTRLNELTGRLNAPSPSIIAPGR